MANKKSGGSIGGLLFGFFNIGFTVFMFLLPTAGLAYWYLYIRDPAGGLAPRPQQVIQQAPPKAEPQSTSTNKRTRSNRSQQKTITSGFFDVGTTPQTYDGRETPEPQVPRSARKEYETRTWTDQSGSFSVEARFYSVTGDNAKIVTAVDQREVEVPIARLSDGDKEYLRSVFRQKGIQPTF